MSTDQKKVGTEQSQAVRPATGSQKDSMGFADSRGNSFDNPLAFLKRMATETHNERQSPLAIPEEEEPKQEKETSSK